MKRDFTSDNLGRINKYIDEITVEGGVWDGVVDFFIGIVYEIAAFFNKLIASILSLFMEVEEPSGDELKWYYQVVIDKNEELKYQIGYIFEKANKEDQKYAKRGELLLTSGRDILKELNYLIEIATPDGISNIAKSKAPNIIISSILDDASAISEADLIAFCNGNVNVAYSSYLAAICDANNAVLDIDGMDMFLVILFNFKDVAVDTIVEYLNTGSGDTKRWISKQILSGADGFMTVKEIADRVGCDVETVEWYLEHGTLTGRPGFGTLTPGGTNNYTNNFNNEIALKNSLDQIIAEHVKIVYENDEVLAEYCKDNDLELEYIKAIRDDDYSGYEQKLYYENIGKILEKAGDSAEYKKNFDLHFSDAKKILGVIKDGNGIWEETTEEGKLLKKMWKNEILSDAEARKFLKTCCGYETVSADDIKLFRGVTDNINQLGGVTKVMGKSQQGLDAIAYWTADFTQEVDILDSVIESAEGNPSYTAALYNLRDKYTEKFQTTLEGAVVDLEKKMINKGVDAVLDTVPAVGIVETAIDIAGTVTGASGYTGAVMDLMTYPGMANQMLKAYNSSVEAVAAGDMGATENVRLNFTALKQTLSSYYDKSCDFYGGMISDAKADPQRLAYSRYMKDKVGEMELGKPFEYLSFDEYIDSYSI